MHPTNQNLITSVVCSPCTPLDRVGRGSRPRQLHVSHLPRLMRSCVWVCTQGISVPWSSKGQKKGLRLCLETQEGPACGLLKAFALGSRVTHPHRVAQVRALRQTITEIIEEMAQWSSPITASPPSLVLQNGEILGVTAHPRALVERIRLGGCFAPPEDIHHALSVYHASDGHVYVHTDEGRIIRPLLLLVQAKTGEDPPASSWTVDWLLRAGWLRYVDAAESCTHHVAMEPSELCADHTLLARGLLLCTINARRAGGAPGPLPGHHGGMHPVLATAGAPRFFFCGTRGGQCNQSPRNACPRKRVEHHAPSFVPPTKPPWAARHSHAVERAGCLFGRVDPGGCCSTSRSFRSLPVSLLCPTTAVFGGAVGVWCGADGIGDPHGAEFCGCRLQLRRMQSLPASPKKEDARSQNDSICLNASSVERGLGANLAYHVRSLGPWVLGSLGPWDKKTAPTTRFDIHHPYRLFAHPDISGSLGVIMPGSAVHVGTLMIAARVAGSTATDVSSSSHHSSSDQPPSLSPSRGFFFVVVVVGGETSGFDRGLHASNGTGRGCGYCVSSAGFFCRLPDGA